MAKKIFMCFLLIVAFFSLNYSVKALTKYEFNDWVAEGQYGTKEKISDNITRLKEKNGSGPYSKASTSKLKDGITEETYIKIDFPSIENSELFEVSLALRNGNNEYVSEAVVMTQKSGDNIFVTAGWAPSFKATIKENGIYTYQWKMFIKDNKTYVRFTILNYDKQIATTGNIDFDTIVTKDTKNPITSQKDVSVKYLWFCNIDIKNGIDVYTNLPIRNTDVTTQAIEDNPNTSDNTNLFFVLSVIGLGVSLVTIKSLVKRR